MDNFFKAKEGRVVVIDQSGAARTLLAEVVRGLGFGDVNGVPGIKEAVEMMEVDPVDWVITPLMEDQKENGMLLLKLMCSRPELRKLRISFLLEESEREILPDSFERGLLSYHSKPFTKDSLTNELNGLLTEFESYDWNGTLLAASFLRNYLMESASFSDLLVLEKKLMDLFPGRLDQMLHTVPPLAKLGRIDEAISTLKQVKTIDPAQEENIQSYLDEYCEGQSLEGAEDSNVNFLGLNKILIVDNDESIRNNVQSIFSEMGVEQVLTAEDGEEGIKLIEENEDIDLVIQEWRLPKLTGPLFLQKAQEKAKKSFPFILLSSLVETQDQPFVKEMGVASVITKPIEQVEFTKSVIWTIQQDRLPTEQSSMERKMRQYLGEGKVSEASEIKERYISDQSIKIGSKQSIEAEFSYQAKEYEKARDFGVESIKHSGDSIFILNLLGKTMMNLREFDVALKCFQKAQSIAPMNLERLCQIAEAHSEMGNEEEAKEAINEAQDLDPDSERVLETTAKVALNAGNSGGAKEIMSQLKAMENVVSYMNNQAVAMARCDMVNEGIQQYQTTLAAIPEARKDILAIVSFNLALAHLRSGNPKASVEPLQTAIQHESKVKGKSEALLGKVQSAIKKGVPLNVQKAEPISTNTSSEVEGEGADSANEVLDSSVSRIISIVEANPGEMACYLIFHASQANEKATNLSNGEIRFSRREAIERGESGGADKIAAS